MDLDHILPPPPTSGGAELTLPPTPGGTLAGEKPTGTPAYAFAKTEKAGGFTFHIDTNGTLFYPDDPAKRVTPELFALSAMRAEVGASSFDQSKIYAPFRARMERAREDPRNMEAFGVEIERQKQHQIALTNAVYEGDLAGALSTAKTPAEMQAVREHFMGGGALKLKKAQLEVEQLENEVRPKTDTPTVEVPKAFKHASIVVGMGVSASKEESYKADLDLAFQDGDWRLAYDALESAALDRMGQAGATAYLGDKVLLDQIDALEVALDAFKTGKTEPREDGVGYGPPKLEEGKETGKILAMAETAMNRFGTSTDTDLVNINNTIQTTIMAYRKAISGAAFTEAEAKAYEQVFPSIGNTSAVNAAKIKSIRDSTRLKNRSLLAQYVGGDSVLEEMEALITEQESAPAQAPRDLKDGWYYDPVNGTEAEFRNGVMVGKPRRRNN